MPDQHVGTVVIGGSQASLAVGYHLRQRGRPFVILDENDWIGDAWRKRWDSLRLFTPAPYDGLPGMPFPGSRSSYPTKDEAADYLETYARVFELPVRTGVKVRRLSKIGNRFEVTCGGQALIAANTVVATGAYNNPGSRRSRANSTTASSSSIRRSTAARPKFRKEACWWWAPATPARRSPSNSLESHNGVPSHDRGIVESCPGLYFVGLPFLYSLSSALLGGVGRDAKHIVDHIVSMRPS